MCISIYLSHFSDKFPPAKNPPEQICQNGHVPKFGCSVTFLSSSNRCFVGIGDDMVVEDCLERDKANPITDPRETSRSVSEMKEWGCSKMDRADGTVVRDCMKLYTGGEAFRVCYTNTADGSTCMCSRELCNGDVAVLGADVLPLSTLLAVVAVVSGVLT